MFFFSPFHSLFALTPDAQNAARVTVSLKMPQETPARPWNTWKDSVPCPEWKGGTCQELCQLQIPESLSSSSWL